MDQSPKGQMKDLKHKTWALRMTQFAEVHIQAEFILKWEFTIGAAWGVRKHFQESEMGFHEVSNVVSWLCASIGHMTICIL